MNNQEREIMSSLEFKGSNIEEMEKILKEAKAETEGRGAFWCCGVEELFDLLVNSLKDLHEENTRLQSEIAKHSEYIKNLKKEIKELKND